MTTQFKTLKNGKNAQSVFANYETKKIVSANRNSFGYNVKAGFDKEFDELASKNDLKKNLGKNWRKGFSYSKKDVESLGFILILRGETILF
jgi:hypothetical protein